MDAVLNLLFRDTFHTKKLFLVTYKLKYFDSLVNLFASAFIARNWSNNVKLAFAY